MYLRALRGNLPKIEQELEGTVTNLESVGVAPFERAGILGVLVFLFHLASIGGARSGPVNAANGLFPVTAERASAFSCIPPLWSSAFRREVSQKNVTLVWAEGAGRKKASRQKRMYNRGGNWRGGTSSTRGLACHSGLSQNCNNHGVDVTVVLPELSPRQRQTCPAITLQYINLQKPNYASLLNQSEFPTK